MDWREHILEDPGICHGQPCFKGTRVLVTTVLDELASGRTEAEILASYPSLRRESIPAAIGFAASLARNRLKERPRPDAA